MNKSFISTYSFVELHARIHKHMAGVKTPVVLLRELQGLAQGLTRGAFIELLRAVECSCEKQGGKAGA